MKIRFEKTTENQNLNNPTIQIMDCSTNKKLLVKRLGGILMLSVLDKSGGANGSLALRLKTPYAKNFSKLTEAILPLNDFIVEKIEVRGGE